MKQLALGIACITLTALASFAYVQDAAGDKAQDSATQTDKDRDIKIRKLMKATGDSDLGKDVLNQLFNNFGRMGAALPAGFLDKFKELANAEDLVDLVVPIYAKHVDAATLDAAIKFYESPAGKRWTTAHKVISQESRLAGQTWAKKLAKRVQAELRK